MDFPSVDAIYNLYLARTRCLWALNEYFKHSLSISGGASDYLTVDRGLSPEMIADFGIGYAPDSSVVLDFLRLNNIDAATIREAGVLLDPLVDRITFPIYNLNSHIIGFSSRVWQAVDNRPKYYNSLTSPSFWKSLAVYGIHRAQASIIANDFALVVEGNLDVVWLHAAGLTETVAPCGTALTTEQLRLLQHLTHRVVFCFDNDEAGCRALVKAKKLCEELGLPFLSFTLEGAKDPAEFIQKYGASSIIDTIRGVLHG